MTRDEFIQLIKDEITVGCALPFSVPDKEFHRIINQALNWAKINYQYAVSPQYFVIKRSTFDSNWKKTRTVLMPDCVISIFQVKEIKGHQSLGYFGADFSADRMIAQEIYLSPFGSDDLVMRTAYESYWDLTKAFFLENIAFDYNHNSKEFTVLGRDPKFDVFIQGYVAIADEKLFDDWTFQRYCSAQAKISLGRILTMFDFNLPGGITINGDDIKSEGKDELDEILEKIDDENAPDWMFIYH